MCCVDRLKSQPESGYTKGVIFSAAYSSSRPGAVFGLKSIPHTMKSDYERAPQLFRYFSRFWRINSVMAVVRARIVSPSRIAYHKPCALW